MFIIHLARVIVMNRTATINKYVRDGDVPGPREENGVRSLGYTMNRAA